MRKLEKIREVLPTGRGSGSLRKKKRHHFGPFPKFILVFLSYIPEFASFNNHFIILNEWGSPSWRTMKMT